MVGRSREGAGGDGSERRPPSSSEASAAGPDPQADEAPNVAQHVRQLQRLRQEAGGRPSTGDGPSDDLFREELELLRRELPAYEVIEHVRYGGQGAVYRARQLRTNRLVALKLLLDGPLATERQRERFLREIEVVARLRHPNVVSVYDGGVVRNRHYYAMEFVEGVPIDDHALLHDLSPRDVVRLMLKVCGAVEHAHQNGVIHRDLNPANILVDEAGEPRVFDFGLAVDLWQPSAAAMTAPGCGTLPYMSPEQAGGYDGRVDVRTDVYALGLILYQLLADALPYTVQGEPGAVRAAIISAEPLSLRKAIAMGADDPGPILRTVDRDLEIVLDRALAKEKKDRYQTVAAFAGDLERWLAGDAVSVRSGSRLYVARKFLRRHRVAAATATTLFLALGIAAGAVTHFWLAARAERDNARSALGEALDQFDLTLGTVEDSVRPLPGGVAVRDKLMSELAARLPRLRAQVGADAALEPMLARLLEKQADIASHQGERAAAYALYAELAGRFEREPGAPSDAHLADWLRVRRKLALDSEPRLAALRAAVAGAGARLESRPSTSAARTAAGALPEPARYELAELHMALSQELEGRCFDSEALAALEPAAALCPGESEDERWLALRARLLNLRGRVRRDLGAADGQRDVEDAVALRRRLVERRPADVELRTALVESIYLLGDCHYQYGRAAGSRRGPEQNQHAQAARELAVEAADEALALARYDPDATTWMRLAFNALHRAAAILSERGSSADELRMADRYIAELGGMLERWSRTNVGGVYARQARVFAAWGEGQREGGAARRSQRTLRELRARAVVEPVLGEWLRAEFADRTGAAGWDQACASREAELAHLTRDVAAHYRSAIAAFERGRAGAEALVAEYPDDLLYATLAAITAHGVGLSQIQAGFPERAVLPALCAAEAQAWATRRREPRVQLQLNVLIMNFDLACALYCRERFADRVLAGLILADTWGRFDELADTGRLAAWPGTWYDTRAALGRAVDERRTHSGDGISRLPRPPRPDPPR